jgi:hypothetical protein
VFIVLMIICLGLLLPASGCFEKTDNRAELEQLDALYMETENKVNHLTDFFFALSEFDLENALFLNDSRQAIEESRADAEELRGELEALRSFEYKKELQQLGSDISDYCDRVEEALNELDEMYQPLLDLLQVMEPTLREEAVITQMEAPQTDADFKDRITRISTALESTVPGLEQVQVPETLKNYKLLLTEMFGALQRAAKPLLDLATGQGVPTDLNTLNTNPDMDRFMQVLALNGPLMLDIKESLIVYKLDDCMQKVEDDFFDLFLQFGMEEEKG